MREVHADIEMMTHASDVIRSFTRVDELRAWWDIHDGLIHAEHDGTWSLAWDIAAEGFGYVILTGYIRVLGHAQLLIGNLIYCNRSRPILGPMTLSVTVEEASGIAQVHITQGGFGTGAHWDWYYNLVGENWPIALEQLKAYLEGRDHV